MKRLYNYLTICTFIFLTACASEQNSTEGQSESDQGQLSDLSFTGTWKLVDYQGKEGEDFTLTACDSATTWEFTDKEEEPLGDGTEVSKLIVTAPDDCKFYGFEAKWTSLNNGQFFISTSKIGGIGGPSSAGLFSIEKHTSNDLVLKSLGRTYIFSR